MKAATMQPIKASDTSPLPLLIEVPPEKRGEGEGVLVAYDRLAMSLLMTEDKPTELPVGVVEAINDDGREETETRWGLTEVVGALVWVEEIVASVGTAEVRLFSVGFAALAL